AGCWALVGGRVPGATEGVVLRLHGATNDAARTWVPMGADSLLVRLAGSSELRLERSGDRLSGQTRRARVVGAAGVAIEFGRVACPEDGGRFLRLPRAPWLCPNRQPRAPRAAAHASPFHRWPASRAARTR